MKRSHRFGTPRAGNQTRLNRFRNRINGLCSKLSLLSVFNARSIFKYVLHLVTGRGEIHRILLGESWHSPRMSLKILKSIVLSKQLKNVASIVLGIEHQKPEANNWFGTSASAADNIGMVANSLDFFQHSPKPFSINHVKNTIMIAKQLPRESELLINLEKCLYDISECNRAICHIQYLREKELGDKEHADMVKTTYQNIPSESTECAQMYEGLNLLEMINLQFFLRECFSQARTVVSLNPSFPFHRVSKRLTELAENMLVEKRSLDYLMFPSNKILCADIGRRKFTNTTLVDALWDVANNLMQKSTRDNTQPVKNQPHSDSYTSSTGRSADILSRFNKVHSSLFLQFIRIWRRDSLEEDLDSINMCLKKLIWGHNYDGSCYIMDMPLKVTI